MASMNGVLVDQLIDAQQRTVSPRVFWDPDVYWTEQEQIFGHCWLYVGHESQIPQPGDFLTNTMGQESVIVCRDLEGQVRVFVNSCRHRGMRICRVDAGNTRLLQCPYHGWTYNLQGNLLGHEKEGGGGVFAGIDRAQWGLLQVPRVESYRGLIFACFDPHVQSLESYLGDIRWYLDLLLNRSAGGVVTLPGTHKWTANTNWKFASEQFSGDVYHVGAHESMFRMNMLPAGIFMQSQPTPKSFHVRTDNAHTWLSAEGAVPPGMLSPALGEFYARLKEGAQQRLTPQQCELVDGVHVGLIFPNLGIVSLLGMLTLRLWQPRSPNRMEIWSWAFVERDAPPEIAAQSRQIQDQTFSPAGIFEQDDLEMWEGCAESAQGFYRRRFPLNYQTGWRYNDRDPDKPGMIDELLSDRGCFGFYQRWRELMHNGAAQGR